MKKVLIAAVCLALILTLVFTLSALGKKQDKPGKLEYVIDFTGNVEGMEVKCGVQGRFISSSNIDRPKLWLNPNIFDKHVGGWYQGQYLDLSLSKHEGEITMQFFFIDPTTNKKVQLNVYGGTVLEGEGEGEWLSQSFTIIFDDADAEILPTTGKREPLWGPETVTITVVCAPPK